MTDLSQAQLLECQLLHSQLLDCIGQLREVVDNLAESICRLDNDIKRLELL